jgi:hypothetical protein
VYGATGFTGRQVAGQLAMLGDCELVLVGRDRSALTNVVRDCAGARVAVATLEDSSSLVRAVEGCRAVIGCAGPFRRTFTDGHRARMMRFPGAEIVLLPRHLDVGRVDVSFTSRSTLPRHVPGSAGIPAMATIEWVARTPLYPLVRSLTQRLPAPSDDIPHVAVECEASNRDCARRFRLTARGAYRFTAAAVCEAARRVVAPDFHLAGPLTPAQAFEPATFLDALARHDSRYWEVDAR